MRTIVFVLATLLCWNFAEAVSSGHAKEAMASVQLPFRLNRADMPASKSIQGLPLQVSSTAPQELAICAKLAAAHGADSKEFGADNSARDRWLNLLVLLCLTHGRSSA